MWTLAIAPKASLEGSEALQAKQTLRGDWGECWPLLGRLFSGSSSVKLSGPGHLGPSGPGVGDSPVRLTPDRSVPRGYCLGQGLPRVLSPQNAVPCPSAAGRLGVHAEEQGPLASW